MNTEQAFNLSVALSSTVLLLVSLLIRDESTRMRAIGAFRLSMLANVLSWLVFMTPEGSVLWMSSYSLAAVHLWAFVVFAGRRAGKDLLKPAVVLFVVHNAAYLWAYGPGGLVWRLHFGMLFYAIATVSVCHSMLRVKRIRTISDVGVAVSFLVLLVFALARSIAMIEMPDLVESSDYLLYVIWPAFYTATGTLAMIGYLEEAQRRRYAQALRDPLTGLLNRRGFDEHRPSVMAYAARQSLPVTVIALDIDHFKSINDRYGHATGDMVLCAAADVVRRELRQVDLPVRFGGEEFIVLLAYGDRETGLACAERMRSAMQECEVEASSGPVRFSASFGVATAPGSTEFEQLYRQADAALYRAKAGGRNRVEAEPAIAA